MTKKELETLNKELNDKVYKDGESLGIKLIKDYYKLSKPKKEMFPLTEIEDDVDWSEEFVQEKWGAEIGKIWKATYKTNFETDQTNEQEKSTLMERLFNLYINAQNDILRKFGFIE